MVEVFKTNIENDKQAKFVLNHIHEAYPEYSANFDLDDCDNILRVECHTHSVSADALIALLKIFGFTAEVLPDEINSPGESTSSIPNFGKIIS